MNFMKVIILSLVFISATCKEYKFFNLPGSSSPPMSHVHMNQLLELCYADGMNPIAITPNLVETMFMKSTVTINAPIIVINNMFVSKDIQHYYPSYPLYVLMVNTTEQLENLLSKLKSSTFWSIKSTFFVIGNSQKFCKDASEILKSLWQFELLSSFVICSESNSKTSLYTYNPFTKRAPDRWKSVKITDNQNSRWTVYRQTFVNDPQICRTLIFDKTKFLDGYPVKIGKDKTPFGPLRKHVFPSLNMTQIITSFGRTKGSNLLVNSLKNGKQDISTTVYSVDSSNNEYVDIVPVNLEFTFVIVTQKRTFLSSFREITYLIDINSCIAIIIILLFMIVMIILYNGYQVCLAISDVLRLLLNMSMLAPLRRLRMKIMFLMAFLFVFIFNPVFQGQIFAILTRPSSYKIESLRDLYIHKYHLHYFFAKHKMIINEQLWTTVEEKRYLHPESNLSPYDCLELAIKDNTVACLYQSEFIVEKALERNLYVSKNFVFKKNYVFRTRKNWAVKDQLGKKVLNMIESGLLSKYKRDTINNPLKKVKAQDRKKKNRDFQKVDAIDLEYLYVLMIFLHALAILIFGVEYLIGRLRHPRLY